jgi:hypothetical protein
MKPALRGTYIHKSTELDDKNLLDIEKLDLEIYGYIQEWRKFLQINNLTKEKVIIEQRYYSKKYGFAGTIDRVYPDYPKNELWLVYLREDGYKIQKIKYSKELLHKFLIILEFTKIKKEK